MAADRDTRHPVWTLYDAQRDARLNVKYYCIRVVTFERWNLALEFILAAAASGSAIAGLAFWSNSSGKAAWQAFSILAAVIAVAKPLLKLPDRIRAHEAMVRGYRVLEHDLAQIERDVQVRDAYDNELRTRFESAMERLRSLKATDPEKREIPRLVRRCCEEVERELPARNFFLPTGGGDAGLRAGG